MMKISPLRKEKMKEELLKFIEENRRDDYVKMPSERELSENFRVSRTTIRSALKEFINRGLLVQFQGKGTYITPKPKEKNINIITSPDIRSDDPFYTKFFLELTRIATKEKIKITFINLENLPKDLQDSPLIMIGLLEESFIEKLGQIYKILISIEQYLTHDEIIQISIDDYRIGWVAADILINYGYRYLVHMAGPEKYTAPYLRKIGFLDRVKKERGLEHQIIEGKMNWNSGYFIGKDIIDIYKDVKEPLGIFAANDWMAIGLIQRLREGGIKVGENISIIGCDDIPLSKEIVPSLATFKWNIEGIIKEISHLVNDIYIGKSTLNKRVLLPARLIVRDSLVKR
ncbi:MAG TPA: substrate-binding domain-containing protein [Dictyoglomaceae bacterium]|nr:substrate-binding domain-containing protein [Dictyoglomaceae bacterium]HOL39463.1 substrate-binding domain-containing protein [Dictyoglomaceae bacterium]HPP15396.1 substrate-binding domain-containing protein [Dictyoglomaceae bacterium]HPU43834.1 substrate-binding domain-containing protein [Dictyoglomaceae bacterium]